MKFKLIILLFFILILAAAAGSVYWLYNFLNTPRAHDKATQFIQVPRGSSPADIAGRLQAEGIIGNALLLQIYLRLNGSGANLKAGEYQFKSPITPLQVIAELEKGEERTTKLTIPEGWTRYEIAKEIIEKFPQNPQVDDKAVLALMDDTSLIKDFDPAGKKSGRLPVSQHLQLAARNQPEADHKNDGRSVQKGLEAGVERAGREPRQKSERDRDHCFADRDRIEKRR